MNEESSIERLQKITKKERVRKLEKAIYTKEVGERQQKTRRIGGTSKRTNV
jgi:hypothetical protein